MILHTKVLFKGYLIFLIGISLSIKICLIPYESIDYLDDLVKWCNIIVREGYMAAFKSNFSNYTPLYLYFLVFISKVFHSSFWLIAIKSLSILFDFFLAFYSYRIIRFTTQHIHWAMLGGCFIFSLPSVILNGSMWGQCDSIYSSLILASFYYFLRRKNLLAFLILGIAISLKLQSIFIFPVLAILFFSNRGIKVWHFLLIPLIYFLSAIPAWIAGGDLEELLRTYLNQANNYEHLTMLAPSVYALFPNAYFALKMAGILFTGLVVVSIIYSYFVLDLPKNDSSLITFAFIFVCIIPYFLPAMHERYYFLADIFSLIYCFCRKEKFYFILCFQAISVLSYLPFLLHSGPIELHFIAIFFFLVILKLLNGTFKPYITKFLAQHS